MYDGPCIRFFYGSLRVLASHRSLSPFSFSLCYFFLASVISLCYFFPFFLLSFFSLVFDFMLSRWRICMFLEYFSCLLADHVVPEWQPRELPGMIEARSVHVKNSHVKLRRFVPRASLASKSSRRRSLICGQIVYVSGQRFWSLITRAKPAKMLEPPLFGSRRGGLHALLRRRPCSQHLLSSLAPISIRVFALRTLQCVVVGE